MVRRPPRPSSSSSKAPRPRSRRPPLRVAAALLWSSAAGAQTPATAPGANGFPWPEGARAAVSLTFDDARASQVDVGLPIFDRHGVKVTFFLVPSNAEQRLAGWKEAAAAGHEIGNHSLDHPCTGNFVWARQKALEDYTLERMQRQFLDANARLRDLLGVTPEVFAYPCGQTFVGRGLDTRSYVPLVAATFVAGRGWLGEAPNDPERCDLAQVLGMEMDGKDFEQVRPLLEQARQGRSWLVLAGHDIGEPGVQTTRAGMLEKLLPYLRDPANGFWTAPMGTVAHAIRRVRAGKEERP
jgi:peptidoglycan/xylan/chitin deacetylase (PgdA/CDA1 family)